MEIDIVDKLHERAMIRREGGAEQTATLLDDAADEIDTLRAELATAWMVKDDLLAELAKVREQRDKARRWYCRVIAYQRKDRGEDFDPEAVAVEEGWDCYEEKEGGGA